MAGFVWLAVDNKLPIHDSVMAWVAFTVTMYAGISMVSNAPFFSGKSFALGRSVPFWGILLVVAVFVFVSSDPPVVLFGLFVLYGLSGWIIWALRWNRARRLQQERRGQGIEVAAGGVHFLRLRRLSWQHDEALRPSAAYPGLQRPVFGIGTSGQGRQLSQRTNPVHAGAVLKTSDFFR